MTVTAQQKIDRAGNPLIPGRCYLMIIRDEAHPRGERYGPLVWYGSDGNLYDAEDEDGDSFVVHDKYDHLLLQLGEPNKAFEGMAGAGAEAETNAKQWAAKLEKLLNRKPPNVELHVDHRGTVRYAPVGTMASCFNHEGGPEQMPALSTAIGTYPGVYGFKGLD